MVGHVSEDRPTILTFSLIDNGQGDSNPTAGLIDDPSGVGVPTAAAAPTAIPTLSEWGLIFLSSLLAFFGIRQARRRDGMSLH